MRKLEAEAMKAANFREAVKGYTTSTLTIHIERQNLNVVQFFKNIPKKWMFDRSSFAKKHF